MEAVVSSIVTLAAVGLGAFLSPYLTTKGKNRATIEDFNALTAKVEQLRLDGQTQLERVKSELTHSQLINRTQFELELSAYREVWEKLIPLHRAAASLRPVFDQGLRQGETDESRRMDRLKVFADAFNPFTDVVWKHKPFYPASVFAALFDLQKLIRKEALDYQHNSPQRSRDYWENAEQSIERIGAQVDVVCETIRERLSVARVA